MRGSSLSLTECAHAEPGEGDVIRDPGVAATPASTATFAAAGVVNAVVVEDGGCVSGGGEGEAARVRKRVLWCPFGKALGRC
ncbi:hypothetical protein CTA1_2147 [Colletotrichum tanaceti]|uniref:Uncharacterized protein n=1 Tax=Colletotrichum tanaceti TaxID=1306861 RepID=A0A4U6XLE1_9PEZI|nr:hypothetical protein CTA1_2147 [Colletotrichum tanaceti]